MSDENITIDQEVWYTDPITEKTYRADLVTMVDQLLFKVRKKPLWDVVDFCVQIWAKKQPDGGKKYFDAVKEIKSNRKNKHASTEDKQFRYVAEPPGEVIMLLDKVAQHKINEYGKQKFWREFARRYPGFSVAEKI